MNSSAAASSSHPLAVTEEDQGACQIDKTIQGAAALTARWQRRRLGGIIAAVSGCRVFLDWREHHGGEGTSDVYLLLTNCIADIQASLANGGPGKMPDVVFMDNACALEKYAMNPRRAGLTPTTLLASRLHYMLDIWHVHNHTACLADPVQAAILDPRSEANQRYRGTVNTEACEQAFSFIDRITYVSYTMGRGMFHVYAYLIMDMENEKVTRRRSR